MRLAGIGWGLAALAWLALAATAVAADLPMSTINRFKTGVTTRAEILAVLGAPLAVNHNPDGRSTAVYDYSVPPDARNPAGGEMAVVFLFDAHDVLLGGNFYAKTPPGAAKPPGAPAAGGPPPGLQDENLLMPVPEGFKPGSHIRQGPSELSEWTPAGETVHDWSRMVTQQIIHGRGHADPDALPTAIARSWAAACPGGVGERTGRSSENGYPVSAWTFRCPLNPQTGKPENMWMKVIAGADALYDVQYAYRRALSDDLAGPAQAFLGRVLVCDTRGPEHPCPSLKPVNR